MHTLYFGQSANALNGRRARTRYRLRYPGIEVDDALEISEQTEI